MLGELTIETGELPDTATYYSRVFVWVSDGSGEAVMPDGEIVPSLGKLTLRLKRSRRWDAQVETATYAVQEVDAEEPNTRLFLLLKLNTRVREEPYKVTLGGSNTCRCKAGRCRVPAVEKVTAGCKHRDAVAALIRLGVL